MAEKEGFEPSKLPLFKGKIEVGVYLVCAFVHFSRFLLCFFRHFSKFYPHLPFRSGKEYMWRCDRGRTVLILLCVPSPIQKCT